MNRTLSVFVDDEPLAPGGRFCISGKTGLGLYPYLFLLRAWNLTDSQYLQFFRGKTMAVMREKSCLAFGKIADVYRRTVPEGTVTVAAVSLGLDLWEARVSLSAAKGDGVFESVRALLENSGTGITLLDVPGDEVFYGRGHSFFGRASVCVAEALAAAGCRGVLTRSGLKVVREGYTQKPLEMAAADLTDEPRFAEGGKIMVLSTTVTGFQPGDEVVLSYRKEAYRGLILERMVEADNGNGPWRTEMMIGVRKG